MPEIALEASPALIDRTIESGFGLMRFPTPLERRFEADTSRERCRQLCVRGLLGLTLLDIFLLSDLRLMPDVFSLAMVLRLAIITPLALVFLFATLLRPPAWIREGMQAVILIAASCITPILMYFSESPHREAAPHGLILVVLFATIVQRVRFWYALGAVLAVTAIHAGMLMNLSGVAAERTMSYAMVFAGGVIFSLIASYSLEREQRLTYLLSLRDRLKNSELETMSRVDPLTGLENRRALDAALAFLETDAVAGEDVAVLLLDIDHFKAYNDALGHQAGDLCLQQIAGIIRDELRMGRDDAFRFGGEEFLLVLRRTDLSGALSAAERMRQAIEDAALPHPETRSGIVTASFGAAAMVTGAGVSADELISSADAALYAAKRAGRNQVWPRIRHSGMTGMPTYLPGLPIRRK